MTKINSWRGKMTSAIRDERRTSAIPFRNYVFRSNFFRQNSKHTNENIVTTIPFVSASASFSELECSGELYHLDCTLSHVHQTSSVWICALRKANREYDYATTVFNSIRQLNERNTQNTHHRRCPRRRESESVPQSYPPNTIKKFFPL